MQSIFKKLNILSIGTTLFLVVLFFGGVEGALAQTGGSIVKCGQGLTTSTACTIGGTNGLGSIIKGVLTLVISIGLPLLFIFVAYRFVMAWFSLQQGNANAYKDALQKAGNAIVGFLIVVVLIGGGLYTILSFFGVKPEFLKVLDLFSGGVFQHAHAQSTQFINPTKYGNLYDFILGALRLVMRFFIYPALIVIWVWTGFSFVLAQGAPEALSKAKKWLMMAFITTLVIVVLQGFLIALRNSVTNIIGTPATATDGSNYGNEGGNAQPRDVNNTNYGNEGLRNPMLEESIPVGPQ